MSYETQLEELRRAHKKIVIVGQQPQSNDPEDPLSCDHPMWSGYRLMQMSGLSPEGYRETFHRINLNYLPDRKFSVSTPQKNRAAMIWTTLHPDDILVILGTGVMKAFKGLVGELEPLQPHLTKRIKDGRYVAGHSVVLIPHPSGLNRWYNNPENTRRAAEALRGLAGGMGIAGVCPYN